MRFFPDALNAQVIGERLTERAETFASSKGLPGPILIRLAGKEPAAPIRTARRRGNQMSKRPGRRPLERLNVWWSRHPCAGQRTTT